MKKLLKHQIFVLFLIFTTLNLHATTLQDVIKTIKKGNITKAYYMQKNLADKEKEILNILLLLYQDKLSDAELISEKTVLSNVLLLPDNSAAIVVNKVNETLFVIKEKNGIPIIVKTFKCITGKKAGDKLKEGDLRTPEGIYLPTYWKAKLPKFYGIGAFVLNYPNVIDRIILRRNGHGIWIHGMEGNYRAPHSTNGCIVLKNEDLANLKKYITPKKTPIIIVNDISKEPLNSFIKERNSLVDFVYNWKTAWENSPKGIENYFSFYSKSFANPKYSFENWKSYKRDVTSRKKWIKIKISNLTITKDGRILKFGRLYLISFNMDYFSNNYRWKGKKIIYVTKEEGKWKILGEESL